MDIVVAPAVMLSTSMPALGDLMGTSASAEILQEINSRYGTTFFGSGDRFSVSRNAFMTNCVMPLYSAGSQLQAVAAQLAQPDQIVWLSDREAFNHVPTAMRLPILTYAPMRELLESGRIEGWGFLPEDLPVFHSLDENGGDAYGRILSNGRVEGVSDHIDEETGKFTVRWRMNVNDPKFTSEERDMLRLARTVVDEILEHTNLDPTDMTSMRG